MDETKININITQASVGTAQSNADKSKAIKKAARKTRVKNIKQRIKKILLVPWRFICRVCRALWRFVCHVCRKIWEFICFICRNIWKFICFICRNVWAFICWICRGIWNWAKSIHVVGMINLILLVLAIILLMFLISDFSRYTKHANKVSKASGVETLVVNPMKKVKPVKQKSDDGTFEICGLKVATTFPGSEQPKSKVKSNSKTVRVVKNKAGKQSGNSSSQVLSGDVIVDMYPSSPVLANGVKIDGNLFVQNMHKYTIPCDAKINGHLFIRNVDRLYFCGKFIVNWNVYVNRQSSFGAIPKDAKINGQIIL